MRSPGELWPGSRSSLEYGQQCADTLVWWQGMVPLHVLFLLGGQGSSSSSGCVVAACLLPPGDISTPQTPGAEWHLGSPARPLARTALAVRRRMPGTCWPRAGLQPASAKAQPMACSCPGSVCPGSVVSGLGRGQFVGWRYCVNLFTAPHLLVFFFLIFSPTSTK